MAKFEVKTRNNADPRGKARVYFTCHPSDFDWVFANQELGCFEKICDDVLHNCDCAIYYTPDMSEPFEEKTIGVDLGQMNLFIVPVTARLMLEDNRAMTVDIAYAKENNIPILPFLMEGDIDHIYSLPKNFGDRQYLNPNSTDSSEVKYIHKLQRHLGSLLLSGDMSKQIKSAFDAYVFLSYRKKDRHHANDLMRTIHDLPGCRDIAIWYDEFLALGESWRDNIKNAMKMVHENGNLFTLLVTPNVLEEYVDSDGNIKKNFVMENEYPEAKEMGMDILPTEVEETDHKLLSDKYKGIPTPVYLADDKFNETILSLLSNIKRVDNDDNPEHNFLIGLAYLEGVDVEVNTERGIKLVTMAAEAELPEAMILLCRAYLNGEKVSTDYNEALKWASRLVEFHEREYGREHIFTLILLDNLASVYHYIDKNKEVEIAEEVYSIRYNTLGCYHPHTEASLENLALIYGELDDFPRTLDVYEKLYDMRRLTLGEDAPATVELNETLDILRELSGAKSNLPSIKTKEM